LIFTDGFVAPFRLLARSESGIASALAGLGFAVTIMAASTDGEKTRERKTSFVFVYTLQIYLHNTQCNCPKRY
jgi:hypothetical protein